MGRSDGNDDVVADLGIAVGIAEGEAESAAGDEKRFFMHEVAVLRGARNASG